MGINKIFQFLGIPALLIAIAWLMSYPVLTDQLVHAHDSNSNYIKSVAMAVSWANGDLSGRWTPDILWGHGYPMFNFYSPLFFYIAAALSFIFPMVLAYNTAIVLVFGAAGFSMYLLAKEFWGKGGGLLAAAAYVAAPYHLLNLVVRGAPSELTAYALMPFVLWALYRLSSEVKLSVFLPGVFAAALVLLAHNIAALFFFPVFFVYSWFLFLTSKQAERSRGLAASWGILMGGAALSVYFWLPAMLEKGFVQINRVESGRYDFHAHFASLGQLIYSAWGYGGSSAGGNDAMSFMIGPVHLVLALAGICFVLCSARGRAMRRQGLFFLFLFLAGVFMSLEVSVFVWERLPLVHFAQFPWRFLMIITLAVSVLAGGAVRIFRGVARSWASVIAAGLVVVFSLPFSKPYGYESVESVNKNQFLFRSTPRDNMEYLPVAAKPIPFFEPAQRLQTISGQVQAIDQIFSRGTEARFRVYSSSEAILVYHSYYFPGWKVAVEGRELPLISNPPGLIVFPLPSGEHQVRIWFTDTSLRRMAGNISMTAVGLFVVLMLYLLVFVRQARIKDLLMNRKGIAV